MKNMNKKIVDKLSVNVEFEVGRTTKTIEEIVHLKKGSVIKLEDSKKDNIRMTVNDEKYAEGKTLRKRKNGIMFIEIKSITKKGGDKHE